MKIRKIAGSILVLAIVLSLTVGITAAANEFDIHPTNIICKCGGTVVTYGPKVTTSQTDKVACPDNQWGCKHTKTVAHISQQHKCGDCGLAYGFAYTNSGTYTSSDHHH